MTVRPISRPLALALACTALFAVPPAFAQQRQSDPQTALVKAEAAMLEDPRGVVATAASVRRQLDSQPARSARDMLRAQASWLQGEASGRLADLTNADRHLADAAAIVAKAGPRSLLAARIMLSRGSVAFDKGEIQKAFTSFRDAFSLFAKLGDTRGQALALQSMGLIYIDAGDFTRVLRYYAQSAEIHPGDARLTMSALNNQALAYKGLGRLDAAAEDYRRSLSLARETDSAPSEAIIYSNLAAVELERGRIGEATRAADAGFRVANARASETLPLIWAVRAQIAWARGDAAGTIAMLPKVFGDTPLSETSYLLREAHAAASQAYIKVGDPANAYAHLQAVNRLDADAREIRSSANAALMAAQFDYSNQELRIARRDAALAQSQARTQWIALGGSLLLLGVSLIAFFRIRRSRNQTLVANIQLNKALAAKSEFLATTSHEIRTPLNGIMGMTQVLLHTPGVAPDVHERISLIDGAGKAMKAIVDDLLDMAKIEAGEVVIERGEIALPRLLEETARIWAAEAEAKGVAVSTELSFAPKHIIEDERKLRQIVFNLVSNAIKFTQQGEVKLSARADDGRLIVSVEDSGIGIPADQLDAIFEAFHQVDGATTRQHNGTGLGLSISSKLAGELGGRITVTSEVGRGSCFTLDLPLVLAELPEAHNVETGPLSLAQARVLLLDRNPLFQSLAAAALDGKVASLETADSFADALGMGRFDALIVDAATLGEAPVDILASALGTALVLTLLPPGSEPDVARHVIPKHMPPLNIGLALEALLGEHAPERIAA